MKKNGHEISSSESMVQKYGTDLKDFPDLLMHMQVFLPSFKC